MHFGLGTFSRGDTAPYPGLLLGERVYALAHLGSLLQRLDLRLEGADSMLAVLSAWERNFAALRAIALVLKDDEPSADRAHVESADLRALHVHAPIHLPRQIFCAIGNYRSHITDSVRDPAERRRLGAPDSTECVQRAAVAIEQRLLSAPYVCTKLPSTVAGPLDALELPTHAQRVDWELELGVVIGRRCRRVSREQAMEFVAGYTLVNDITVRELVTRPDLPRLGSDWLQSKSAPGFLPMGPYFMPAAFVPDPYALRLTLRLNGEIMQDELAADMLFDIAVQIAYISQHAQLLPGDVICTGTPAGCGARYKRFLQPGDVMQATAEGFGTQCTPCVAEPAMAQA
jgi:2,4-didehydro-3-deoxy-L-rhamnonate hydrolase